jgi:YHS domain-containing protein
MDAIDQFATKVQSRIAAASQNAQLTQENVEQYMREYAPRREQFEKIAAHWLSDVIRPRMLRLGSFFANARNDRMQHSDRCVLWLGYCERFPANVKLEFSVEQDESVEKIAILYELRIVPTFLKFTAHDKLTIPLEEIHEAKATAWVEEQLLRFVDTYSQIDRGSVEAVDELVTDPVCGMRLAHSAAVAQSDYKGHSYFFCTSRCLEQFLADPTHYVLFRPNE